MKPIFPILFTGLACVSISAAASEESIARFSNNDQIAGTMESLSSDLMVWKSSVFEKPVPIFVKNLVDLSLAPTMPTSGADHEATLTLKNGDIVRGQLALVTDEVVGLDTWFAGRMNFKRVTVVSIKIKDKSTFLYHGPTGLADWTLSKGKPAWTYAQSAFLANGAGGIAKDGLLPEECAITFDAAWKSDALALKVMLFSDDPSSNNSDSGYELSFNSSSIFLRNSKSPQGFLGSTHSPVLKENTKVKIEIRASRKTGKVCLFLNDSLTEVWSDPDFAQGKFGSCLHFVSQNALPLRISGISVVPWDGIVDQVPPRQRGMFRRFGMQADDGENEPAPSEATEKNRMELANGDSLDGEVTSIENGVITMKTSLGDLKIPVDRFRTVALKKVDLERCIRRNGDVRATLADGSSIVFRLDGLAEGMLTGSSQNFGTASFRMDAFSRIEFNIYDPNLENKRQVLGW